MKKNTILLILLCCISFLSKASEVKLSSPDKSLNLIVSVEKDVSFKLFSGTVEIMSANNIRLETDRGDIPAANPRIRNVKRTSVNNVVKPVIKEKRAEIPEIYNEAMIELWDKSHIQFRVYNNGIAYRFVLDLPGEITIKGDHAGFGFADDATLTFQKDNSMNSDYEKPYVTKKIADIENGEMGNLPALVSTATGNSILFLEAGTQDYPCMWIAKSGTGLSPYYWAVPAEYNTRGNFYNRKQVTKMKDYIAKTTASRNFPWKVFAVAGKDTDLLENQLVYLLGEKCRIEDTSWIHPGWVTFDWWARRGLYGVDFKAGVNNETAKYMIDFASNFGIRYFLFDDGWTANENLTTPVPEVDMAEIVRYARSKNVDVMLWVAYSLFDDQMDAALKKFSEWGIKGVKIDFMNRSDQEIVGFYWKAAEQCARHKMAIDFHGAYRPDGLRRAYPNVLTREALIEFEYNGGTHFDNPDHHCTLPFIRNVAGPMDYIPGTMNNATKKDFRINGDTPMGQGTRAHSLALAVITESPMQMLSDAQSDYYRERECTEFLTQIPVEWDEIVPLNGKVGDYVSLARRKGNTWYVASITDWDPRILQLQFSFLEPEKTYRAEIIRDGINADIRAIDYKKEIRDVRKGDIFDIKMVSGGGWIAKITEK